MCSASDKSIDSSDAELVLRTLAQRLGISLRHEQQGSTAEWFSDMINKMIVDAKSGTVQWFIRKDLKSVRFGEEDNFGMFGSQDQCRDCNAKPGDIHDWGCCIERCARCFGQRGGSREKDSEGYDVCMDCFDKGNNPNCNVENA